MPPPDLDALSAYLDGQLPPAERSALEARLAAEPALRQELEALRAVVTALHSLPPLLAPRNLTLTPEQIQPRPYRRIALFPAFVSGLSTLAAALLLIAGFSLLRPAPDSALVSTNAVAVAPTVAVTATLPEQADLLREIAPTAELEEPMAAAGALAADSANAAAGAAADSALSMAAPAPEAQTMDSAAQEAELAPAASPLPPGALTDAFAPAAETGANDGLQFQFAAPTSAPGAEIAAAGQALPTASEEATRTKEATVTPEPLPTLAPQPTSAAPAERAEAVTAPEPPTTIGLALIAGALALLVVAVMAGLRARRGA